MKSINFTIVTQERVVYEDNVLRVTVPTRSGEITILPRHAPLVSLLKAGVMTVYKQDGEHVLSTSGGIIEVRPGSKVVILADTAERGEEIDEERAEAARRRAEEMLKEKEKLSDVQFAALQAQIEKEVKGIKAARKYRRLPPVRNGTNVGK